MSPAENKRSKEIFREIDGLKDKLAEAERVRAEEAESDRLSSIIVPMGVRSPGKTATLTSVSEPALYRAQGEITRNWDGTTAEPTFLQDLYRSQVMGDPAASERLARHGREVERQRQRQRQRQDITKYRAIGTAAVSGFVPPQYLTDLFAEYARGGRPTANLTAKAPLPATGMSFQVPRITTATATA